MVVYSGVLTAVTLGVVPLFLALTFLASPAIKSQLRKAAQKNAAAQSLLVEALNGVRPSRLRTLKIRFVGGNVAIRHL